MTTSAFPDRGSEVRRVYPERLFAALLRIVIAFLSPVSY